MTRLVQGLIFHTGDIKEDDLSRFRALRVTDQQAENALPIGTQNLEQKCIVYQFESLSQQQFKRFSKEQHMASKIEFDPPLLMPNFSTLEFALQGGWAILFTYIVNDTIACYAAKRHDDTTIWFIVTGILFTANLLVTPLVSAGMKNIETKLSLGMGGLASSLAMLLLFLPESLLDFRWEAGQNAPCSVYPLIDPYPP